MHRMDSAAVLARHSLAWPFAVRAGLEAARFGAQSARNPAAQYGTSRSWTLSRSLERQAPPDSLSMRPVSANVSVSAPDRK